MVKKKVGYEGYCEQCGVPISRKDDTDYQIIWDSMVSSYLCKQCFVEVVLQYCPTADFHLPKHKFDTRTSFDPHHPNRQDRKKYHQEWRKKHIRGRKPKEEG